MKLSINQQAPEFSTVDVYGNSIDLKKLRGKKVFLAFERNAGCPVCNLRTHELLKQAEYFTATNTAVIMIYESSVAKMKEYLGENTYPFNFVADPGNVLYKKYGIEQSTLKFMKGMFHGLMSKVNQGTKLFKKTIKQDGHLTRIPAEFMVDERGNLKLAHYGRFIGDHLPFEILKTKG
jgi:thioredoxin-dependent peroxiredoxin